MIQAKLIATVSLVLVASLAPVRAHAVSDFKTCLMLLKDCELEKKSITGGNGQIVGPDERLSTGIRIGYVNGFVDEAHRNRNDTSFYVPEGSTVAQWSLV